MKAKIVACALLAAVLAGCESKNPASIAEERAGRPTPTPRPAAVEQPQAQAPPAMPAEDKIVLPTIRPGTDVANNLSPIEPTLAKLDLAQMLHAGTVKVELNDPSVAAPLLFDGSIDHPARTESINPLVVTLTFAQPVAIAAARIYPTYATYDWALYPDAAQTGLVARGVPQEQWSRIDVPQPKAAQSVQIELVRTERDNYVHVNEIELYIAGEGAVAPPAAGEAPKQAVEPAPAAEAVAEPPSETGEASAPEPEPPDTAPAPAETTEETE